MIRRDAIPVEVCEAMLERVIEIARVRADGGGNGDALVLPERHLRDQPRQAEDGVSKIFKLHRDPVFAALANDAAMLDPVTDLPTGTVDRSENRFGVHDFVQMQ